MMPNRFPSLLMITKSKARPKSLKFLSPLSLASQKRRFVKTTGSHRGIAPAHHLLPSSIERDSSPNLFGDYRVAFSEKTAWELARSLTFFNICRFPGFAEHAFKVMEVSYKVLGKRLTNFMIRKTVYDQFVAGENLAEMSQAIHKLRQVGVNPILMCPMELFSEDAGISQDVFFDDNTEKVLDSIDKSLLLNCPLPMVEYKFTAFMCGELLTTISPLCQKTMHNKEVLDGLIEAMKGKHIDFSQLPEWQEFPAEKNDELCRALRRIGKINEAIQRHDTIALADAEYTFMNPALRQIGLCSIMMCNEGAAKVFYTYQAYLKSTLKELTEDLQFCEGQGLAMGVKLVRGAYMVQERKRAKELGYPDPVNPDFEATTQNYLACLDLLMNEAARVPEHNVTARSKVTGEAVSPEARNSVRFIIASHNEDTVLYAMKRMKELSISKSSGVVFFGQLYGMRDNISFMLGKNGYSIYKCIPYGSIADTLPYLSRRAQENTSILDNVRRERTLVSKALKDRILRRQ